MCALHELEDAARFADRVAVLGGGRLLALDAPASVLTPTTLRDAFGVDAELRCDGGLPSLRVYGEAVTPREARACPRSSPPRARP